MQKSTALVLTGYKFYGQTEPKEAKGAWHKNSAGKSLTMTLTTAEDMCQW